MDYFFNRKIVENFPNSRTEKHYSVPSFNLYSKSYFQPEDIELKIPCLQSFGYKFDLYKVLYFGESSCDIAERMKIRKILWTKELKRLQPEKHKAERTKLKAVRDGHLNKISVETRLYVEHIASDPLPGYNPNTNWIFTGGTIASAPSDTDESKFLLASGGSLMSSLCKLKLEDGDEEIIDDEKVRLKMSSPILEVAANNSTTNPLVCSRQRNNINMFKSPDLSLELALKWKCARPHYFTSVAPKDECVAMSKNTGGVVIFDVEANKLRHSAYYSHKRLSCPARNYWNQLLWKDNSLWIYDAKSIHQIDERIDSPNHWDISSSRNTCEESCCVIDSARDPNMTYVASNHSLLQVDLRQRGIVQKWLHLMRFDPHYGSCFIRDSNEYIVLQSEKPGEVVGIINTPEYNQLPPKSLQGLTQSVIDIQLEGHCLEPNAVRRTEYNIIGSNIIQKDGNIHQVTQNAGGDIFMRQLVEEDMEVDAARKSSHFNHSWSQYELHSFRLEDTKPINAKILDAARAFQKLQPPSQKFRSFPRRINQRFSRCNRNYLSTFQDTLAEKLLSVWHKPESSRSSDEEEEELSKKKVNDWLTNLAE